MSDEWTTGFLHRDLLGVTVAFGVRGFPVFVILLTGHGLWGTWGWRQRKGHQAGASGMGYI